MVDFNFTAVDIAPRVLAKKDIAWRSFEVKEFI